MWVLTKVAANDAVPHGTMLLIEFLLYKARNILLHSIFFQSLEASKVKSRTIPEDLDSLRHLC